MTKNKLDKMFGPVGTSAGIFMFLAGLVMTYFSWSGLILALIGAFIGFTSTSTLIDLDKKRLKFSSNIFGIIQIGQWISVQADMKIGMKQSNQVWRAYSQSNRTLDIANDHYQLILYDASGNEIMPMQKSSHLDALKLDMDKYTKQLGIGVI
ncbi:hypothetical protein BFP97_01515 [Roseivirga sp. 4D4]|uniref:hypothetical protein n=1 Tax=Roseivirga sp. 4D4 TaxID=1889784 RepID=UPI000852A05A|nr:hypothetical protein [Roseivirga sp. 4D4]OEK00269.1 hypothetical protein BFP97_01515 [Roseivirga sp. 4D4]